MAPAGNIDAERDAILAACYGFRSSALLFAAFELRVFENVPEAGAELGDLAEACGAPPENLHHLLSALVAVNLLALRGQRYVIPEPLPSLLRPGAGSLGPLIENARREYAHWQNAAAIVRGRHDGPPFQGETLDPEIVATSLDAVERSNRAAADSLWPHLEGLLPDARRALDLGGGHCYYTHGLLQRSPRARVTVVDLPQVIEDARRRLSDSPHQARVQLTAGDAREIAYDREFDLALVNDLLVYFDRDQKRDVLVRVRRALRPGGALVTVNQRRDDSGCTPPRWAVFSWRIFVHTGRGYIERDPALAQLIRDAGFADVKVTALKDERTLITATRPLE